MYSRCSLIREPLLGGCMKHHFTLCRCSSINTIWCKFESSILSKHRRCGSTKHLSRRFFTAFMQWPLLIYDSCLKNDASLVGAISKLLVRYRSYLMVGIGFHRWKNNDASTAVPLFFCLTAYKHTIGKYRWCAFVVLFNLLIYRVKNIKKSLSLINWCRYIN